MASAPLGVKSLPVELLYELQLFAFSESLPLVSHHLYDVFKHASPFFNARYIMGRILSGSGQPSIEDAYTKALKYPICNQKVLQALGSLIKGLTSGGQSVSLPRRIFRSLQPPESGWSEEDEPIPLLQYLFGNPDIPRISANAHGGYALTRAVHAKFVLLVQLLLDYGASPKHRDNLAVQVAIRQKNLEMVKMLVERQQYPRTKGKKSKTMDRIPLDSKLLKIAFMADAQEIVQYIHREKGVVPDVETLKRMAYS